MGLLIPAEIQLFGQMFEHLFAAAPILARSDKGHTCKEQNEKKSGRHESCYFFRHSIPPDTGIQFTTGRNYLNRQVVQNCQFEQCDFQRELLLQDRSPDYRHAGDATFGAISAHRLNTFHDNGYF